MTTPPWLSERNGELRLGKAQHSASVYLANQPQYVLLPVPAKGKYACRITETINGRRLDGDRIYASAEEALRGGLDELREKLGW